jgi:hypothetical protein
MAIGDLITQAGQLQWRGLLLGLGTDYDLTKLDGWEDMPPVDVGSKVRPRSHGADPGVLLAQPHVFTATFDIDPLQAGGTAAARRFVRAQTGPPATALLEAVAVSLDAGETLIRFAQLTARKIPLEINYENIIKDAVLQWECADPRLYALAQTTVTCRLPLADPASGSGAYPQTYPFAYASLIAGGGPQAAVNNGNAETPPVYTFTGPLTNPVLTISDTTGTRRTVFGITLAAGEQLVVDVLNKTVTDGGASRYGYNSGTAIEQLTLAPGTSQITLSADAGDATASLTAVYRDATI